MRWGIMAWPPYRVEKETIVSGFRAIGIIRKIAIHDLKPRRGRRHEVAAPAGSTRGLRGLRGGLDLDRHPWPDNLGFPLPWRPQEAVPQEIEVGAAKHLPLQHFETIDMALHRATTPGQGHPGFDRRIVV